MCPEIPGFSPAKSMEVRFFAPAGSFDFQPGFRRIHLRKRRRFRICRRMTPGLDVAHIGQVIPAASFSRRIWSRLKKKALGLPHWDAARRAPTPRRRLLDKSEDELYNGGKAFKVTCRTTRRRDGDPSWPTTITATAKKKIKTQISYSANLFGRGRGRTCRRRAGVCQLQPG